MTPLAARLFALLLAAEPGVVSAFASGAFASDAYYTAATGCAGGQVVGNTGSATMDVVDTTRTNYWCKRDPAKTNLQNLKPGVGQGSFCGWKVGHTAATGYVCGTCLKVTCGGHVGYAAVVDSNEINANQFMDVHDLPDGFWNSVCPTTTRPDICSCDWEVVGPDSCYDLPPKA